MKLSTILGLGISLAVISASPLVPVTASPLTKINQRVQFAPGKSGTTINGSVPLGKQDTYTFRARKGQTIITDITWRGTRVGDKNEPGLSGFTFVQPNGERFEHPQDIYFIASSTGEYKVIIAQPYRMTSPRYTFKLTIR